MHFLKKACILQTSKRFSFFIQIIIKLSLKVKEKEVFIINKSSLLHYTIRFLFYYHSHSNNHYAL